jgi:hypothetical protein
VIPDLHSLRKTLAKQGLAALATEAYFQTIYEAWCYNRNREHREKQPDVWVHIGAHKTGTSSLQWTLNSARWELRRNSVYYDDHARELVNILFKEELTQSRIADLNSKYRKQIEKRPQRVTIFSSERFSGAPYQAYTDVEKIARGLRGVLDGLSVKIIAVVRRQDRWTESIYQQYVKVGNASTFDEFKRECGPFPLHWDLHLDAYAECFGAESLHVHAYETLFQSENPIDTLFAGLKPPFHLSRREIPHKNPGLSQTVLEILRRCNDLVDREQTNALRRYLEGQFPTTRGDRYSFFKPDERRQFLEQCWESNQRMFEKYMPGHDASIYAPDSIESRV